ncbi:hypothetical protein NM688_g6016 [Phlebia brevispora]|uniref:Uncharacterized protein n=1 Tax=Phlebia brevispora TaxID=194682 RepID=A0ACC1SL69_9APHY|nr:hypothetical protein NM688_g6016 [Phlebia brevispora]
MRANAEHAEGIIIRDVVPDAYSLERFGSQEGIARSHNEAHLRARWTRKHFAAQCPQFIEELMDHNYGLKFTFARHAFALAIWQSQSNSSLPKAPAKQGPRGSWRDDTFKPTSTTSKASIVMRFTALTTLLLGAVSLATGAPTEKRVVWSPPILTPNANTTWYSGDWVEVTWDASDAPENISERAYILLRYFDDELPIVLAHDFDLRAGAVAITVPEVVTSPDFSIVLFGDSGNWGDTFTIIGPI